MGVACGLQVYAHVSFMVHWVALWLFMVAMTASALFLAALVSRPRWVNLLSFLFLAFIIGYSFGLSVTPPNPPFFLPLLYLVTSGPPFSQLINGLLPVYHYDKLWLDMSLRLALHARAQTPPTPPPPSCSSSP